MDPLPLTRALKQFNFIRRWEFLRRRRDANFPTFPRAKAIWRVASARKKLLFNRKPGEDVSAMGKHHKCFIMLWKVGDTIVAHFDKKRSDEIEKKIANNWLHSNKLLLLTERAFKEEVRGTHERESVCLLIFCIFNAFSLSWRKGKRPESVKIGRLSPCVTWKQSTSDEI